MKTDSVPAKIVLVDDDVDLLSLMVEMLECEGFLVRGFSRAQDALDALAGADSDANLVISDYRMPEMDGVEFITRLRSSGAELPVILLTALTETERLAASLKQHRVALVPKPFELGQLLARMSRLLDPRLPEPQPPYPGSPPPSEKHLTL